MQNYKEINGNDYVKDSRTTINETMQSIQSMNSGTVFPTTNLFEGMKCYRTDLKKTYTLTDVEKNTWVEDAHAALADEATHAASTTKLQTPRALNLSGAVTADAASFDGTADATINVKTLDASKLKGTTSVSTTGNAATATKLAAARTIALSGNASGSTTFDGSGNATINATVSESAHAATATKVVTNAASGASANIAEATMASNDLARIRVSGETNAGELALETADDGSEPIVARQYTGIYTTPVRTAKILDESGNTSFPGTVVAPKFTGTLNGNAATATKLQTPRTLSLSGKAAGSATFDGSSNAAINVTSVNADTASKLSTARKINITGNASGSASFDGSGNIDIKTTVSEAAHAQKATDADTVGGVGIRSENDGYNKTLNKPYIPIVGPDGAIELGNMVDIHSTYGAKEDFNVRLTPVSGYLRAQAYGTEGQQNTIHTTGYIGDLKGNASTASKLATPRTISLTGNASGSASFDGSGNVSISTTVNESKHAAEANALNSMGNKTAIKDGTREPLNLSLYQVYNNGYPVPYGNLLSIGGAGGGELLAEWSGADKGIGHLYYRNRRDAGYLWSDWRTVAFTSDINSFAPTKTGGGASGTWGINISGNADNADKLDGYHASDIINKISAANTGGIVAASLTENGYVKFANGLILQWGNITVSGNGGTASFTYPVAMSAVYFATCNPITNLSGDWDSLVMSTTVSSCKISNCTQAEGKVLVFVVGQA